MTTTDRKTCFVTIGATAAFNSLLEAVLQPSFVEALHNAKYTDLLLQCGKDGKTIFDRAVSEHGKDFQQRLGMTLSGFDFNKNGLAEEMRLAKGARSHGSEEGVVISHAGSGSILEALRIGVPLIVVPNTDLLHNHQVELAVELAKQDYVVYGKLSDLPAAIIQAESLRTRMQAWPPTNSGTDKPTRGLEEVMNQEMGWVD